MKLTVVDRAIIASNFLNRFGTIAQIKRAKSIKAKIELTDSEQQLIKAETDGTGVTTCFFEPEAYTKEKEVEFTEEELAHILSSIDKLDKNGMIEESIIDTIYKLMSDKEKIKAGN